MTVYFVDYFNMFYEGNIIRDVLADDMYHLNDKGVSILASNIKKAMHRCLHIDLPIPQRQRSRSRSRGGRGRGHGHASRQSARGKARGRGLLNIATH